MFFRCSQRGNGLFFVYCTVAGSSSSGLRDRRWCGSCTAGSVISAALARSRCYCQIAAQFFQGMRSARHCYGTCSDFCVPWKPLSYCFSLLTSRQVSWAAAENGKNDASFRVSRPQYCIPSVWSQSRWQRQHAGPFWFSHEGNAVGSSLSVGGKVFSCLPPVFYK